MTERYGVAEDGAVVRVSTRPELLVDLVERWPGVGLRFVEQPEGIQPDLDLTLERVGELDRLESDLGLFAVAHLTHLVGVHAALLVYDRSAILVPGVSFTGKSTLALAAARAGITVASDEYALVDPRTGLAIGFTRPLRERVANGVRRLDLATATDPIEIRLVAAIAWHDGRPQIDEITRAEVVMAVLSNTVCARTRSHDSLDAAVAIARTARGLGGRRGEADDTLTLLTRTLHV